jgi:hypothetical protein
MARQCPRGHDGIEPEEDADDTSTQHQLTKPKHHRGQGLATRGQARGHHGRSPERRKQRGSEQWGSNQVDLADRRNRSRLIYQLSGISAAETDGARRNRAWRRHGDAVARWIAREERNGWARGKGGGRSEPTEPLVGFNQLAGLTGGPGMAVRERVVEGEVFNQKWK